MIKFKRIYKGLLAFVLVATLIFLVANKPVPEFNGKGGKQDPENPTKTYYITNVDKPKTVEEIKQGLSATDDVDGEIGWQQFVVETDGYTGNENTLGEYDVVYAVSDSGGNTAKITITVKVVDVAKPVLTNSGDTKATISYQNVLDLNTLKAQLSASDNYDSSENITIALIADGYTANSNRVGAYEVQYQAVDTSGNRSKDIITFTINVEDKVKPVISGTNEYKINLGVDTPKTITELKDALTALDEHDGDVSSSLAVKEGSDGDTYTGNEAVLGEYQVVFVAKDASGNQTEYPITVRNVDETAPVIELVDGGVSTIDVSYTEKLDLDTIMANLKVSDNADPNPTLSVKTNNYVGHETELGAKTIIFTATDASGNVSNDFVMTINVVDDVAPVISGVMAYTVSLDKDEALDIDVIKSNLSAIDAKEGSVQLTLVSDDYTANVHKLGEFEVKFSAKDTKDNEATCVVKITNIDEVAPTIKLVKNSSATDGKHYGTYYKALNVLTDVVNSYEAIDNVDKDVSVVVSENNYQGNEAVVGEYTLTLTATDSSGNIGTKIITIYVIDNIKPNITVADDKTTYTVKVGQDEALTVEAIKATLTAEDEYDGTLPILLESDDYTGNEAVLGEYHMVFSATDKSDNKREITITINNIEKDPEPTPDPEPEKVLVDTYTFTNDKIYTGAEILETVINNLSDETLKTTLLDYQVDSEKSTYKDSSEAQAAGEYDLFLMRKDGEVSEKLYQIHVVVEQAQVVDPEPEPNPEPQPDKDVRSFAIVLDENHGLTAEEIAKQVLGDEEVQRFIVSQSETTYAPNSKNGDYKIVLRHQDDVDKVVEINVNVNLSEASVPAKSGLSSGAKAGISLAVIAVIVAGAVGGFFIIRKVKKGKANK